MSVVGCLSSPCGCSAPPCGVGSRAPSRRRHRRLTPEETVTRYLEALKAGNLAAAYDYLSAGMVQHKDRADWAKEQQWSMQMSDVKIFEFHVYPGKITGDRAQVPNLLSSQDKFLNQLGLPEHELYTLIREDGRWKIDQQQLLEHSEQGKWFPAPPPEQK